MNLILHEPRVDRSRLAELTGLTNASVSKIVQELIDVELVREMGALVTDGARGRRRIALEVNPAGGYVVGISILAYNSRIMLSDIRGNEVDSAPIHTSDLRDPGRTLDDIFERTRQLLAKHAIPHSRTFAVGVAVAGYIDPADGSIERGHYLDWPPFDLQASLQRRFSRPVVVDNVTRCMALAESRFGDCAGIRELVLIRAALLIGGAIMSSGRIVSGHGNRAGQFGHVFATADGLICSCGRRGCLNTVASGLAVLHGLGMPSLSRHDPPQLSDREEVLTAILERANGGDARCAELLSHGGRELARHVSATLRALDPEAVILTGPLGRQLHYREGFRAMLAEHDTPARVLTAPGHDTISPAGAAAASALLAHVYRSEEHTSELQSP